MLRKALLVIPSLLVALGAGAQTHPVTFDITECQTCHADALEKFPHT